MEEKYRSNTNVRNSEIIMIFKPSCLFKCFSALNDVSKQKDLTGFYRNLYKQALGEKDSKDDIKLKQDKIAKDRSAVKDTSDTAGTSKSDDKDSTDRKTSRQYRKRKNSSSGSEKGERKRAADKTNIDADSDFTGHSSDSVSDSEESTNKKKLEKGNTAENEHKPRFVTSGSEEGEIGEANLAKTEAKRHSNSAKENASEGGKVKNNELEIEQQHKRTVEEKEIDKERLDAKPEPPKRSIWEKRTVGPAFEAALARYFTRKAAKSVC
jgi:coiled-coil domain-containing protein 55